MKKAVKMRASFGSNVTGDVCGFDEALAAKLVARGVAEYVAAVPVGVVTKEAAKAVSIQGAPAQEVAKGIPVDDGTAETETPAPESEKKSGFLRRGKRG